MATKDYRHREAKKSKKTAKKPVNISFTPPVEVEVIKKGKKPREDEELES